MRDKKVTSVKLRRKLKDSGFDSSSVGLEKAIKLFDEGRIAEKDRLMLLDSSKRRKNSVKRKCAL